MPFPVSVWHAIGVFAHPTVHSPQENHWLVTNQSICALRVPLTRGGKIVVPRPYPRP